MPTTARPMQKPLANDTRDILLLLVLALLCYADKILLGPYAVIDFYDTLEAHFSHFQAMGRLWLEYGPFSWYPFHAGGVPAFVGQHPPWHPAVFLSMVLPIWLLALLWNVGQMFLAGYGMYRLLPLLARTSRRTALLMASLYSLVWGSGNVHMVLPYAFPAFFYWTTELFRADSGRGRRLGCGLGVLAVSLFSFPVLTLPHFPVLHLALLLFLGRHLPDFKRQVVGVFVVWTGYVLLYAPSIVSLFQYIPFAQRDWDFVFPGWGSGLLDFLRWTRGRLADQATLGLALFALPLLRKREVRVTALLLLAVLLVSGVFNSDLKALFRNSFLLKMDLFMFATTVGLLTALLGALAVEGWTRAPRRFPLWQVALIAALLPLFGAANKVIVYLLVLGAGACGVLLFRARRDSPPRGRVMLACTLLVVCLAATGMMVRQQFMSAGMFTPYAKGYLGHPELAALSRSPEQPFRVACVDVHPAAVQSYGLDTVGGKSPLFNKYFKEYVREVVRPQLPTQTLVDQFDGLWRQLYLTRNQIDHDQRGVVIPAKQPRSVADLDWPPLLAMNVTHVVAAAPVAGLEQLSTGVEFSPGLDVRAPWLGRLGLGRLHSMPLWIYTLKEPVPRARLTAPKILDSRAQVLASIGGAPLDALRATSFLAREDLPAGLFLPAEASPSGDARITSWSPDRLVIEGRTDAPCVLAVSNNFDPRWRAVRDGRELPVFRADHAFQGVFVDRPGPFRVVLRFSTPLIWRLNLLSGLGVLLLLCGAAWPVNRATTKARAVHEPRFDCAPTRLRCLTAGICAAAVWALLFVWFVFRKMRGPQAETYGYALATIPILGLLVSLWCRRLFARFKGC